MKAQKAVHLLQRRLAAAPNHPEVPNIHELLREKHGDAFEQGRLGGYGQGHVAGALQCSVMRRMHVTRHTSHVTRHTSHVTRHTSHVTRHMTIPPIITCHTSCVNYQKPHTPHLQHQRRSMRLQPLKHLTHENGFVVPGTKVENQTAIMY